MYSRRMRTITLLVFGTTSSKIQRTDGMMKKAWQHILYILIARIYDIYLPWVVSIVLEHATDNSVPGTYTHKMQSYTSNISLNCLRLAMFLLDSCCNCIIIA